MVNVKNAVALSLAVAVVNAAPVTKTKRIAQVISDSTTKWVAACNTAGGGAKCSEISLKAFSTLLAAPGPCEQQDAADDMIDLAKTLKNNADVISLAQVFRQQPRNAPDSLSVLYCQKAPRNAELNGLFQCQFQGCNPAVFTGNVKVGAPGTIPFGLNAALNPAGSCAASPNAPVADGAQLTDTTTNPGVASAAGSATDAPPPADAGLDADPEEDPEDTDPEDTDPEDDQEADPALAPEPDNSAADPPAVAAPAAPAADAKPFTKQNGLDAIALNQKFAGLTANSPCTDGEQACVGDAFAQCVGGKFAATGCAGGTICAALPLVNKAGTSITCTTAADRDARIAATGASTLAARSTPFALQNGKDAIALNQKFAGLSATSVCQAGEQACVGSAFAQCVGGKFVSTPCAGGLVCAALPLVNKAGTSITCTTPADRDARIAATGATAGAANLVAKPAQKPAAAAKPAAAKPATSPAKPAAGAKSFTLKNGQDAKALNAKFAKLSATSACQAGEQACVGGAFAQCVGGKFVSTPCAGGTVCAALPLVNKAGTSITCTTPADRDARIAVTGA